MTATFTTPASPTATTTRYAAANEVNPADFHPVQKYLWRAIENAHTRADHAKPPVVWLGGNEYAVLGSDGVTTYHVILTGKNHLTGQDYCLCKAGEDSMVCYHQAAALNFQNAEREALEKAKPCKQPFAAAVELTLSYSESFKDGPVSCLRRGCTRPVESPENAFCNSCAQDIRLEAEYPQAANWF